MNGWIRRVSWLWLNLGALGSRPLVLMRSQTADQPTTAQSFRLTVLRTRGYLLAPTLSCQLRSSEFAASMRSKQLIRSDAAIRARHLLTCSDPGCCLLD